MRILITGCNGFVASELISRLEDKYYLYKTNRDTLNVLDSTAVDNFFENNDVDYVIHTAISGGRRNIPETCQVFHDNVRMFENLAKHRKKYKLMINFGSGAEKERKHEIMRMSEKSFLEDNVSPSDFYGFSKYIISKRIHAINDNIVNFRVFNVFGSCEQEDRMIKNNIIQNLNGHPFRVYQERIMDFFSMEDLSRVVEYYIQNFSKLFLYKDLNMCYTNKVRLSDICKEIQRNGKERNIVINKEGYAPAYCGSSDRIDSLNVILLGLRKSIAQMYELLKRENK